MAVEIAVVPVGPVVRGGLLEDELPGETLGPALLHPQREGEGAGEGAGEAFPPVHEIIIQIIERIPLPADLSKKAASIVRELDGGVSAREIADVVQAALSGQRYGYLIKDGEQYQII